MALRSFVTGAAPAPTADAADTATVRRIVGQLEAMPRDKARFLAAFAYILTRAAAADLEISDVEEQVIERLVVEHGGVAEAEPVLVVETAASQSMANVGHQVCASPPPVQEVSTRPDRRA